MHSTARWLGLRIYVRAWAKPLGMGAALIALGICTYVVLYRFSGHELRGAPINHGYALVERVALTSKGSQGFNLIRVLTVRVNGQDVTFPTNTAFSAGEVVGVSYRVDPEQFVSRCARVKPSRRRQCSG